jgi:hypothetical protein
VTESDTDPLKTSEAKSLAENDLPGVDILVAIII